MIARRLMALVWAFALLITLLAWGRAANAQAFSRLEAGQQTITAETGLQSGVVTSIGYAAGLPMGGAGRPVRIVMPFVQATLVAARPDLHDYRLRTGGQISMFSVGWFDLSTQLAFEVAGTDNSIYRGTALRTDLVILAGHYGRRWFAIAEAGYDRAWLTYVKNSDWYRTYFYADAKDGWYGGTGGMLHAGAKGGVTIGSVELVARAGFNRTEQLRKLELPFYATLGASYRF